MTRVRHLSSLPESKGSVTPFRFAISSRASLLLAIWLLKKVLLTRDVMLSTLHELLRLIYKVPDILKLSIYAGETHVRNFVHSLQHPRCYFADRLTRDFLFKSSNELFF